MRTLPRTTRGLAMATPLRTFATRASTVDALRIRRRTSPQEQPTTTSSTTTTLQTGASILIGRDRVHWETPASSLSLDERIRSFYSTHIYHGQPPGNTGAGTGVLISAQMFGAEVKGNPTESEADVAADRSDEDPLPPGLHRVIRMPAGEAGGKPTESEEDVKADRGDGVDPLLPGVGRKNLE